MFKQILNFNYILILFFLIIPKTKSDFTQHCPFIYTVDLSESPVLPNGSYIYHNDTLIPPQYVRDYNYTILIDKPNKKNVHTRKRGCICAVKQCLPLCSDRLDKFYEDYKSQCVDHGYLKNVTYSDGKVLTKHLLRDFHPIYGKVCDIENGYMLSPELESNNEWTLYENSMLLRHHDKQNLTMKEYCFGIEILDENFQFVINPVVCGETIVIPWFKIWAMTFSIPFLIITMICYWNFQRENCKCFVVYLSHVTLSYTLICFYTISGIDLASKPCKAFGFVIYFTVTGYLTWTCILSFDTWKAATSDTPHIPSFERYCLIGLLVPSVMTFLTFLAHISQLPEEWKPGMASDMCAVNTLRWSALIYYYIPCIIVFIFSITLYTWIVISNKKQKNKLHKTLICKPQAFMDRFALFFRIFLFMGISWALDILSFFLRMAFGEEEYFVYITLDYFNALHGFLVFLTFICRDSVLMEIKGRLKTKFEKRF